MKWSCSLPKGKPPAGKCFVAYAIKTADGHRMEYTGEATAEEAARAFIIFVPGIDPLTGKLSSEAGDSK